MADLSKLRFNGTDYNVKDASAPLRKFTNYSKTGNLPITSNDTTQTAIGKLEKAHDTNQTNILYGLNTGVKNKLPCQISNIHQPSDTGLKCVYNEDGTYTVTGTKSTSDAYLDIENIYADNLNGDHVAYISVSGTGTCELAAYGWNGTGYTLMLSTAASQGFNIGNYAYALFRIRFMGSVGASFNATVKIMVCTMDAWNQSHDWQPPALPNYDLTYLQAEDRAALAEVVDSGAKNIIPTHTPETISRDDGNVSATFNADGSITVERTTAGAGAEVTIVTDDYKYAGDYVLSSTEKLPAYNYLTARITSLSGTFIRSISIGNNGDIYAPFTLANDEMIDKVYIWVSADVITTYTCHPMICTEAEWAISHDFAPFALPNTDLTYLQAEDRAALAEVVDSGAKNLVDLSNTGTGTHNTVTFTNLGGNKYKINGTPSAVDTHLDIMGTWSTVPSFISNNVGKTIVFATNQEHVYYGIIPIVGGQALEYVSGNKTTPVAYTIPSNLSGALLRIYVDTNQTYNNVTTELLVCTKAAFGVSPKFVPYRMSYQDLCDKKDAALSTTSKTSGSLDDIAENSFYFVSDGTTGRPVSEYGFVKTSVYSSSVMLQEFTSFSGNAANSGLVFVRVKQAGTWQSWKQLTNA